MKTLALNDKQTLTTAVDTLKASGIIIYPTETAYGLGCDATNVKAVLKIFKLKERPHVKTLPVVLASFDMATEYVEFSETARVLAQKYWPGPLALVLPVKPGVKLPSGVIRKEDRTAALRVSSFAFAQKLSELLGKPIAATSANKSGDKSCYSLEEVSASLGPDLTQVDLVIDGGQLQGAPPSTIVKVTDSHVKVLRQGEIKI